MSGVPCKNNASTAARRFKNGYDVDMPSCRHNTSVSPTSFSMDKFDNASSINNVDIFCSDELPVNTGKALFTEADFLS